MQQLRVLVHKFKYLSRKYSQFQSINSMVPQVTKSVTEVCKTPISSSSFFFLLLRISAARDLSDVSGRGVLSLWNGSVRCHCRQRAEALPPMRTSHREDSFHQEEHSLWSQIVSTESTLDYLDWSLRSSEENWLFLHNTISHKQHCSLL